MFTPIRLLIALTLSLLAGAAVADQTTITIPTSSQAFRSAYGTNSSTFDQVTALALNPALKSIASNFSGSACTGIATPVAYQWCVDTTAKTVRLYTPDSGGNFSFHDALNIQTDGTLVPTNGGGGGGAVSSVAGRTGAVTLTVADISGALAASNPAFTGTLTGPNATLSGALNAGSSTTSGTTTGGTVVSTGLGRFGSLSVSNATIVADSTTDISTALNAALTAGDVILPAGNGSAFYRAAATIIVPFERTLKGMGNTGLQGLGNPGGGVRIVCDAGVTPCVQVGTGNLNKQSALYNINVSRAGSSPAAGTIGVWVFGGSNSRLVDVTVDNNEINFLWGRSTPGAGAGLENFGTRLTSTRATGAHMSFDAIPDVRISESHIGQVGTVDYHARSAFRFTCTQNNCTGAGGVNTIVISNTQVNQNSTAGIDCFAEWVVADTTWSGDYEDYHFNNIHAEVLNGGFCSDSSWKSLNNVFISDSFITTALNFGGTAAGGPFFQLDPATAVSRWYITNSALTARDNDAGTVKAFRLGPTPASGCGICELHISNSTFFGKVYLTGSAGSTAWITGTSFSSDLTFDGGTGWAALTEVGDNIGGSYTETAGNNATVFNNRQIKMPGGGVSNLGVTCAAGISATTGRSRNGIVTAC